MSTHGAAAFPPMGKPVVLEPLDSKGGGEVRGTVVWSHGLGDSAHGWLDFAEMLRRREGLKGVRWVLTNAPQRPVTANGGAIMPAWYDTKQFNAPPSLEDTDGMLASVASIAGLVEAEVAKGVEAEKIVVGGFSQGGVMSLLTGLTSEKKLGGVCVLSGFLGLTHEDKIKELVSPASASTPIFWGHGTADPVIRLSKALAGREYLVEELGRKEGEDFEWREYEGMEHSLGREELGDVQRRSLFLLSTALVSTGLLAGFGLALVAPRPQIVNLVFPLPTPHPPPAHSAEAVAHTEELEKGLHELEIVRRLKAEVVPSPAPALPDSQSEAQAGATSLTRAAGELAPTQSAADTPLQPRWTVSRPYAATPPGPHSLSGYALRGPGKFALPPLVFTSLDKKEAVLVVHVGGGLCGHEGVVHGGLLATVCDEALGRQALLNLPTNIGVTATLTMNYKKPTFANQYLVVRTQLEKQQGRKAWVKGVVENVEGEVLAEASALFVEPRFAAFLSNSSVREALK
ncbi:hypothetical protein JCM10213v2_007677 [Rhodosporidiobolus nylandii]